MFPIYVIIWRLCSCRENAAFPSVSHIENNRARGIRHGHLARKMGCAQKSPLLASRKRAGDAAGCVPAASCRKNPNSQTQRSACSRLPLKAASRGRCSLPANRLRPSELERFGEGARGTLKPRVRGEHHSILGGALRSVTRPAGIPSP